MEPQHSRQPRRISELHWPYAMLLLGLLVGPLQAAPAPLNFQEVHELLKKHLAGTTDVELGDAAARGLISQLAGRVSLLEDLVLSADAVATNRMITASLLEREFGYCRVNRLAAGAAGEFRAACQTLLATNALKGLILDLRFSGGQDYAEALAVADPFFAREQTLVDWGEGWKSSTAKTNAVTLPVAILVNRKTMGAAEALAGMLRHREIGLVIGSSTAGQASMARDFQLATGQRIRLAIAPLKVAGGRELSQAGLKPDLEVGISAEADFAWYEDAYRVSAKMAKPGTNETGVASSPRTPRRRINEAELVRMSRDGQDVERDGAPGAFPARPQDTVPPVLTDPVLLRALDLLKGLSVVQQFRSN